MNYLKAICDRTRDFWGKHSLLISIVLVVAAVVIVLIVLVISGHLQTGFCGKTIWDWIEVLAVPERG